MLKIITCKFFWLLGAAFLSVAPVGAAATVTDVPPLLDMYFERPGASQTHREAYQSLAGYVDDSGAWRVLPRWPMATPFRFSDGLAMVGMGGVGGKGGYIGTSGSALSLGLNWGNMSHTFDCKKYAVAAIPLDTPNRWRMRVVNRQGIEVLPNGPFPSELTQVKNRCIMETGLKESKLFYDVEHGELTFQRFQSTHGFKPINSTRSTYYAAVQVDGLWGFLDDQGQIAISPQWLEADSFGETGLARVRGETGWVYIDYTGAVVIPVKEGQAYNFDYSSGYARVKRGGGYGYIDTRGEWLFDKRLEDAQDFGPNALAAVKEGAHWGYLNARGQWAIQPSFLEATAFRAVGRGFVARVTDKDHCMRLIDSTGTFLTNFDGPARRFQKERCPQRAKAWEHQTYAFLASNLRAVALGLGLFVVLGTWFAYRTNKPSGDPQGKYSGVSVFRRLGYAALVGWIGVVAGVLALDEITGVARLVPYFRDVHGLAFYGLAIVLWVILLLVLMGLRGVANFHGFLKRR